MRPARAKRFPMPASPPAEAGPEDVQAAAWHRIADELAACRETFAPLADAVTGLLDRLDLLCAWLKGKWPWIALGGVFLLNRTANATPEEAERLAGSIAVVVKAITGAVA